MIPSVQTLKGNLVYQPDMLAQHQTIFPSLKFATLHNGSTYAAIPHTLDHAVVLNNLGYKAPSPIRLTYDWPGKFKPYAHQLETSEFLTLNKRAFCLNGMGTGKTMAVLWAADYLMKIGKVRRALILSPLSTLQQVWAREIFANLPNRQYAVLHGSRQKRLDMLKTKADFYIINHDGVEVINEELLKREDIDMIIIDECFPAGTKVLTSSGEQCIETIEVGDLVVSSWGLAPVTTVFRNSAPTLITLHLEDGSHVTCTPNHPYATDVGWLPASKTKGRRLVQSKDLQDMWEGVFREGCPAEVQAANNVLQNLLDEAELGYTQGGAVSWGGEGQPEEDRATCMEQRHSDTPRSSCEDSCISEGSASSVPSSSWRKWFRDVYCGTDGIDTVTGGVSLQPPCKDAQEARQRVSELLQSGLWEPGNEDSDRGGRVEPQHPEATSAGHEKRLTAQGVRVVSVSYHEQAGGIPVWNLEVAGSKDYIADGKVVHNCAVLRNQQTKRWKTVKAMVNRDVWCWGLTGTPTPNCPTDAYAQMKLIRPENYTGHFTKFKMLTMMQLGQFKWIPRRGTEEIIANVLKPSLRFALEDCIELPPTIYHDREAELSAEQKVHYKALERQAVTEIRGKQITAVNSAVLISKLTQVACGVTYAGEDGKAEIDFGPRLSVLKEAIEESESKVIIFVPFTGVLDALNRELSKEWSCAVVDGGTSSGKRNQIFDAFRSTPSPRILIANPQTMAHGLTLTEASMIIWYAPIYSNEYYEQANARIVRPGQTMKTNIVHIAATSVERRIYAVLREKGALQGVILDLARDAK